MSVKQKGTKGDDVMFGRDIARRDYHDNINGLQGDDWIYGGLSQDNLQGGAGDDTLIGGPGDDVLAGNAANSRFFNKKGEYQKGAGAGSDTFIFNAGDGHDVIIDFEVGIDQLIFNGDVGELTFTTHFGFPPAAPSTEGSGIGTHWGLGKYKLDKAPMYYTTIEYDGGQIELVGVQATSLAELNGT